VCAACIPHRPPHEQSCYFFNLSSAKPVHDWVVLVFVSVHARLAKEKTLTCRLKPILAVSAIAHPHPTLLRTGGAIATAIDLLVQTHLRLNLRSLIHPSPNINFVKLTAALSRQYTIRKTISHAVQFLA
jgi:hypothetical protein